VVEDRPASRASNQLVGVVPMSVIHQRLRDEHGLEASVASLRRYVRAHFAEGVRGGEVVVWRPPVDPGDECVRGFPHRHSSPGAVSIGTLTAGTGQKRGPLTSRKCRTTLGNCP
jgi:hypothetical protein